MSEVLTGRASWRSISHDDRLVLPLLSMPEAGSICLGEDGEWLFVRQERAVRIIDSRNVQLALLRFRRDEVVHSLLFGLMEAGLGTAPLDSFPWAPIIVSGLQTGRDYWINSLLGWLHPTERSQEVISALIDVASNRQLSQSLRHPLQKLLIQIDRSVAGDVARELQRRWGVHAWTEYPLSMGSGSPAQKSLWEADLAFRLPDGPLCVVEFKRPPVPRREAGLTRQLLAMAAALQRHDTSARFCVVSLTVFPQGMTSQLSQAGVGVFELSLIHI